jgi:hypothetical protein
MLCPRENFLVWEGEDSTTKGKLKNPWGSEDHEVIMMSEAMTLESQRPPHQFKHPRS